MSRDEQQQILLALAVIWVLYEYNREPTFEENFREGVRRTQERLNTAVDVLERAGAWTADMIADPQHQGDLPGHQLTRQALLTLATQARFPDPKLAAAIALAESGGVPGAVAQSPVEYSVGLWQINTKVHPYSVQDMKDPRKNAAAAFQISKGGRDWRPWAAYASGQYRNFKTGILA
jgi:hypothetical protein